MIDVDWRSACPDSLKAQDITGGWGREVVGAGKWSIRSPAGLSLSHLESDGAGVVEIQMQIAFVAEGLRDEQCAIG